MQICEFKKSITVLPAVYNTGTEKNYVYTTGTLGTPTGTVNYGYTNTSWGDQLTSYDGQTITYDAMGNPLTYRGYTFTWQGKQLMSSVTDTQTISFEYNEDGLRQKKTVNGAETDYFYNGSVLIGMQRNGTKYLFSYDASGKVVSVKYNNNEYYYVRNGQGDIVKLIDSTGTPVVKYIYNSWGRCQGDDSSVLTNSNIKQGDCVKRTGPVTPHIGPREKMRINSVPNEILSLAPNEGLMRIWGINLN